MLILDILLDSYLCQLTALLEWNILLLFPSMGYNTDGGTHFYISSLFYFIVYVLNRDASLSVVTIYSYHGRIVNARYTGRQQSIYCPVIYSHGIAGQVVLSAKRSSSSTQIQSGALFKLHLVWQGIAKKNTTVKNSARHDIEVAGFLYHI